MYYLLLDCRSAPRVRSETALLLYRRDFTSQTLSGSCLKKQIDAGLYGVKACGIGMKVQLRKAVEEATMSYRFAFSKEYHWTLGGKLPGLSSPCTSPDA